MILKKEEVNRKHSFTWTRINDDSKKKMWKIKFLEQFGGEFVKDGKYLTWVEKVEPRKILVTKPDGTVDEVINFSKYCRDHELNKSAMYEVLKGSRKQHKGFRATKGE